MRSQVRILPGAPFPCKTGHRVARAPSGGDDSAFQRLSRSTDVDLLIFDHDLVDQQADIGLPQCAIVAPKPIAEETPESTDYLRAIERRPDFSWRSSPSISVVSAAIRAR